MSGIEITAHALDPVHPVAPRTEAVPPTEVAPNRRPAKTTGDLVTIRPARPR
jgi:hypothetical protein